MPGKIRRIGRGEWRVEAQYPSGRLYCVLTVMGTKRHALRRGSWAEAKAAGEGERLKWSAAEFFGVAKAEAAK